MGDSQQPLTPFEHTRTPKRVPGGLYITFEGPECSGKTTQITLLMERLAQEGYTVVRAKQPGGTPVGIAIRQVLLSPELRDKITPKTESLLYWADRYQIYETLVKPALRDGAIVLGDRDFDSSWAFQCYGRGLDKEWMWTIQQAVIGDFRPHKTFLYMLTIKNILQRIESRREKSAQDRAEKRLGEGEHTFHEKVIEGYTELSADEPERFITFDANQTIEQLHEQTYAAMQQLIKERLR